MRPLDRVEEGEDQRDVGLVVAAPAAAAPADGHHGRLALGGRRGRGGRAAVLGVRAALLAAPEMPRQESKISFRTIMRLEFNKTERCFLLNPRD